MAAELLVQALIGEKHSEHKLKRRVGGTYSKLTNPPPFDFPAANTREGSMLNKDDASATTARAKVTCNNMKCCSAHRHAYLKKGGRTYIVNARRRIWRPFPCSLIVLSYNTLRIRSKNFLTINHNILVTKLREGLLLSSVPVSAVEAEHERMCAVRVVASAAP